MAASPARPRTAEPLGGRERPGPDPDLRVRCCSKRWVREVLARCGPCVRELLPGAGAEESQPGDALWNFETAVQENITINGEPWQETSDEDELQSGSDIKILEDQFDELIVETASKRKQCPRKILVHIIKTIKAEQEILKLYKPVVKPQEIRPEPSQADCMADLRQVTGVTSKQISEAMKSLPALIERAEGFSQALALQPVLELCKLRQEVFAGCKAKEENKIQSLVTKVEITPTDTAAKENSVLKRRRPSDAIQLACYPLRRKRISLNT